MAYWAFNTTHPTVIGSQPEKHRRKLPTKVERRIRTDLSWSVPIPTDYADHGWYAVVETAEPVPNDHDRTIEWDGSDYVETWTFNQARQDQRLDSATRNAKADARDAQIPQLRTWATAAAATKTAAEGLADLDGASTIEDVKTRVNQLTAQVAEIYGHLETLLNEHVEQWQAITGRELDL